MTLFSLGCGAQSGQPLTCPVGKQACQDRCVDVLVDPGHCGACGKPCASGEFCVAGQCRRDCSPLVTCNGLCVDTDTSLEHCGQCNHPCGSGTLCLRGTCTACLNNTTACGDRCVDTRTDPLNCGACNKNCSQTEICLSGVCTACSPGLTACGNACLDTQTDTLHCGGCNQPCSSGAICQKGVCSACPPGLTNCKGTCVDQQTDLAHCGLCGNACAKDQLCQNGICTGCATGLTLCNGLCVDTMSHSAHCGACNQGCTGSAYCFSGSCITCSSVAADCDQDGWTVSEGDCCDKPGKCGLKPELVNPGAVEIVGNNLDDNCNGLTDSLDVLDTQPCDQGLASNSSTASDYAKSIGFCRFTTQNPSHKKDKTWGVIDAKLLHADGSTPSAGYKGFSIRPNFGKSITPLQGKSLALLASGVAADASQVNPGPNGGPPKGSNVSEDLKHQANILACTNSYCIKDWLGTANLPLKAANALPEAPGCGVGTGGQPQIARDSIMLVLTIRAPTNVKALSLSSFFFSSEYPEFVCSSYNDQLVVLIDTPSGTPTVKNPVDKNLMTYNKGSQRWPIGINIANGTDLFRVCEDKTTNKQCWDSDVDPSSCSKGPAQLVGTGFEWSGNCLVGGGTHWLDSKGNILPGKIVELRIAIWDVGDHILDSYVLLDAFRWLENPVVPGTD